MDSDLDDTVSDLIDQLKNSGNENKKLEKLELTSETLEHFLLNNTGLLVKNSVTFVDDIKDYIAASPQPEDLEALAKLIQASAAAIESLNKLHISNEKNKTMKEIKTMDIESKKQLQNNEKEVKLLVNREELLKQLIENADIIDAQVEDLSS